MLKNNKNKYYKVLKICRKPKNIDQSLVTNVRFCLYFIIFLHIIFAIWVFGNDLIFNEVSYFKFIKKIILLKK